MHHTMRILDTPGTVCGNIECNSRSSVLYASYLAAMGTNKWPPLSQCNCILVKLPWTIGRRGHHWTMKFNIWSTMDNTNVVCKSMGKDLALGLGDQKNHTTSSIQTFFEPNFQMTYL